MRLISRFHDYYDGALKSFYSEDPAYFRESRKEALLTWSKTANELRTGKNMSVYDHIGVCLGREDGYCRVIVGFCGKVYYMMRRRIFNRADGTWKYDGAWKSVGYDEFVRINGSFERFLYSGFAMMPDVSLMKEINEDLFVRLDAPVYALLCEGGSLVAETNPELKPFGFAPVVDPYTAVQELQMYIGNQLAHDSHPEMPVGSDRVIAESKGFDKYSFRKPKRSGKKK